MFGNGTAVLGDTVANRLYTTERLEDITGEIKIYKVNWNLSSSRYDLIEEFTLPPRHINGAECI